jgi:hypothetical protein
MPTYPLTFPSIHPANVKATRRRVQAIAQSPFTLQQQVFNWNSARWDITIVMQMMTVDEAATFGRFMDDLNGVVGTFTFNLDAWCPGLETPPGVRTFRLASPSVVWDSEKAVKWGFQIEGIESI